MHSYKASLKHFDVGAVASWVFDLDNTIYPAKSSLFPRVTQRMTSFIMQQFNMEEGPAIALKTRLFQEYGTTMNGLMAEYDIEPTGFLRYVHDIDLSDIAPDKELGAALDKLPGRKLIYTNGTTLHAERILTAFGIEKHFDFIFDIVASDYIPKPNPHPYQQFLDRSGIAPQKAVMIEDMARNLAPAAALGMQTVWLVNEHEWARFGAEDDFVHFIADDLKTFLTAIG